MITIRLTDRTKITVPTGRYIAKVGQVFKVVNGNKIEKEIRVEDIAGFSEDK